MESKVSSEASSSLSSAPVLHSVASEASPAKTELVEELGRVNNNSSHDNQAIEWNESLSIVSLILIVIGWRVFYSNAKKIATRSETKSVVEDVVTLINDLEVMTTDYWLSGRRNRIESEQFLVLTSAKIKTLYSRLDIISRRGVDVSGLDIMSFVTHMTLNCEDVDRITSSEAITQVELYLESSSQLIEGLYLAFECKYKPSLSS